MQNLASSFFHMYKNRYALFIKVCMLVCIVLVDRASLLMEMCILHDSSCIWLITSWYACFMMYISFVYVYMSMYGNHNRWMVTTLLVLVVDPHFSPIFLPCFRLYLNTIFCMFVGYNVRYFLVKYYAKIPTLRAWIKFLNMLGVCCAFDCAPQWAR